MALHEDKVELLRKVDFFRELREYELDTISRYCEFVHIKKGKPVFVQGSLARDFYVVEQGRVGIINVKDGDDIEIAQIIEGESFGELDFLGQSLRSASAFADKDTMLLRFPDEAHTSSDIFQRHPDVFANMLYRLLGIVSDRIWNINMEVQQKARWVTDLRKQLLMDKLTGLYNRIYLQEDFVNLLPELESSAALLIIKPDNFKEINDNFGHEAGDQVLRLMAIYLQSVLREEDLGVRFRGDEYAAVLLNVNREKAIGIARELQTAYREIDLAAITGNAKMVLKSSIGIAMYPDNAGSSKSLVETAHERMLRARSAGGGKIVA